MQDHQRHELQKIAWDAEHRSPYILNPMDSTEPSSGVRLFKDWLGERWGSRQLHGLEMGCGKGRNSIWLAQHGALMRAFDFSSVAVVEARRRASALGIGSVEFSVHDATTSWPYPNDSFDFVVDCFASTDIESVAGREFARDQIFRVLRPGGVLLLYTLSTDDEFHHEMIKQYPAEEPNSFRHPSNSKFEKVFDREELVNFFQLQPPRASGRPITTTSSTNAVLGGASGSS
jgi:SAM-dependent methyltransferase